MRIKSKLLAGYFLLAALSLLVGLSALQTIRVIHDEFVVVTKRVLIHIIALEDLRAAGLRLVASTSELGFLTLTAGPNGEPSSEAQEDEIHLLEEGLATYRAAAERLRSINFPEGSVEVTVHRDLLTNGDELIALSGQLKELMRSRPQNSKILKTKESFEVIEKKFLSAIDQAIEIEKKDLAASRENVTHFIFTAETTTSAVTLMVVVSALALSLLLAAHIARPILQLKIWAERLGQGEPGLRILPRSRDEVGDLARTFNQMAIRIESAQAETAAAHAYLDGIIRSLGDALLVLAPDGIIRSSNPAAEALLGWSGTELAGRSFDTFLGEPSDGSHLLEQMLKPAKPLSLETVLVDRSGARIPVAISSARLEPSAGAKGEVVCIVHNLSSRKAAEATIHRLAYFDPLTGLPNRALLQDRLNQALARAQREESLLAVLYLNLDRFKHINDSLGHDCGDLFLKTVAERLQSGLRKSDTLARFGGDEFVLLLGGAKDENNAAAAAEHLRRRLTPPVLLAGQEIFPTTSIGIALYPHDGETGEELLKHADMAMSAAKQKGRNTFRFFSANLHQQAQERRDLETKLRRALQNQEFFLVYQPQIDLRSGRIFGVEALLRWRQPVDGLISPARFIPVAEETGLIQAIGEWVLRTACAQNQAWQAAGLAPLQVAVNVSGRQVEKKGLAGLVGEILRETGLPPRFLELELTESSLMENAKETIATLTELKALGLQLSVDDFGTGYSSLSYLKHFPIDRLKIDQSFIRDLENDPGDRSIVEAILGLGRSLKLRVIAEGVETPDALALLQRLGCDEAQGYYFAKPLEAAQLLELQANWQPQPAPTAPIALLRR